MSVTVMYIRRKALRITQTELANRIGVSQGEISLLENGYGPIRRQDQVAKELGLESNELTMSYEEYLERKYVPSSIRERETATV